MKKLWLTIIVASAFLGGYGAVADAFPSAGVYGRGEWRGYFTNTLDTAGTDVFPRLYQSGTEAMPNTINSATEFIAFIDAKYDGGTAQERTGAAFIMETMLEINGASSDRTPSSTARENWRNVVRTAVNHGHVTWRANFSYTINSYYQGASDDAFYDNSGTFPAMIFEDEYGRITYVLKWQCANPVGTPTTFNTYSLEQPWNIDGRTSVTNSAGDLSTNSAGQINTYVGDSLTWRHYVRNIGPSFSNPTTIDAWSAETLSTNPGVFTTISPSRDTGVYANGQEKLVITDPVQIVPNLPVGTNICRTVFFQPQTSWLNTSARSPGHCAAIQASYDLTPTINVQVNGAAGNQAEVGDTITFSYSVNNTGAASSNTACTIYGLTRTGYYTVPATPDSTSDAGYVQPPHGCPRNFAAGNTNLLVTPESVVASTANRSICRSLFVNPAAPGSGAEGTEVCAYVVQKPYIRSYGGDVITGMRFGLESSPDVCSGTSGNNASIIGWNKRSAGSYAGTGAQHGVSARDRIFDFASSLGGAAGPPTTLSFTNNATDATNGNFGGMFDWAPCLPNYYMSAPTPTITTDIDVGALTSGTYSGTGNLTLTGGAISSGERITLYIDGQILINGNITYSGSWTIGQMPMFRLIVRGSVYIDNDVSQLDGLYIVEPDSAASFGLIVTCATGRSTPTLDGTLMSTCDNTKLTVNGSMLSRHIRLTRTVGTLRQSVAGEASTSANIAETLNYGPIMWIPQPPSSGATPTYDAITSLPPVL